MPPGLRRALSTISMLGFATALGAMMVFLTQTLLARVLGPTEYGLFASSLVTVTMIAPLAGFGLTQFRLKAYGVEGWGARRWLAPSLRFTLFTTMLALGSLFAWAAFGATDPDTRFMLLVLSPVVLGILAIDLVSNKTRLEERYRTMALWQMAIPASRLAVALALLLVPQLTGRFVAASYCAISLLVALWALPQLRALLRNEIDLKGHGPPDPGAGVPISPGVLALWSQAWSFGVYAALYPVFFQVSTILLKYLNNDTQAGRYAIALAVMTAIYLIPATIYQKFLMAKLHRWAAHDVPKFWMVYRRGNVAMFVLGLIVSAGLVIASPWVVPIVFGPQYIEVVGILMILAICPPIRFLSTAMGAALLTEDHMRFRVYAIASATIVAIGMNVILIPRFNEAGAAWATVTAESVLLVGTMLGVHRLRRLKRAQR